MAKETGKLGQCTGIRPRTGQPCTEDATRPGIPEIHSTPLCESCRKRIYRQNTERCSEPGCPHQVKNEKSRKERFIPKPWCRLHEHRALAADVIGEVERNRVIQDLVNNIESNWFTGCWHRIGRSSGGYGRYKGRKSVGTWQAHRLAWHIFFPGHERDLICDHLCVNSLCVNPLHLNPTTPGTNIELRDQRREDPDYVWHSNQPQQIYLPLLAYASMHNLVFITPQCDYSEPWNPTRLLARLLDAERIESVGPPSAEEPAEASTVAVRREQLTRLQELGIKKDKTLNDLVLTQYEADYLIGFHQQKMRRLRTTFEPFSAAS